MSSALETFLKTNRELAEAATPGEWYIAETKHWNYTTPAQHVRSREERADGSYTDHAIAEAFGGTGPRPKDAQFIAASRTSLPLALEMLEDAVKALKFYTGGGMDGSNYAMELDDGETAREALAAMEEKAGGV